MVKTIILEFGVLGGTKQLKCATDDVGEIACVLYPTALCKLTCKNNSVQTEEAFISSPFQWNRSGVQLFSYLYSGNILEITTNLQCTLRIDYDSVGTLVVV